jgi:hypothetical protein
MPLWEETGVSAWLRSRVRVLKIILNAQAEIAQASQGCVAATTAKGCSSRLMLSAKEQAKRQNQHRAVVHMASANDVRRKVFGMQLTSSLRALKG